MNCSRSRPALQETSHSLKGHRLRWLGGGGWFGLGGHFLPVTSPPHFVRGVSYLGVSGSAQQIGTRLEALRRSAFRVFQLPRVRGIGLPLSYAENPRHGGSGAGRALICPFRNFYQILGQHSFINSRTIILNQIPTTFSNHTML